MCAPDTIGHLNTSLFGRCALRSVLCRPASPLQSHYPVTPTLSLKQCRNYLVVLTRTCDKKRRSKIGTADSSHDTNLDCIYSTVLPLSPQRHSDSSLANNEKYFLPYASIIQYARSDYAHFCKVHVATTHSYIGLVQLHIKY